MLVRCSVICYDLDTCEVFVGDDSTRYVRLNVRTRNIVTTYPDGDTWVVASWISRDHDFVFLTRETYIHDHMGRDRRVYVPAAHVSLD